ncbi:FHA domain-containing protein [Microbacterium elymi]|uniref:FHA domain-containing protein n=1 Tax=Microbacterium elymi TaxID=2909587 RepID=A0ABY5NNC8_9MICO|nr:MULTISPECIES: FHA domain-containing protein [Microbacterium]UUT36631.1 FHA domain-containing protein [Microbacterium elymi]
MTDAQTKDEPVTVEFAGERFPVHPGSVFTVGREGDLALEDNLFLHRHFLTIQCQDGLWLLSNVGSRLAATVTDSGGRVQAWLAPGARLPLVFETTTVIFSAGPTTYELVVHAAEPAFRETVRFEEDDGQSTIGDVPLTHSQRVMILALAEPVLRREGAGMSELPTSAQAAQRLGWTLTRFNRKLDNVCDKLDRIGVPGMRGGARSYATNRRVRLVEHAIAARLVTREDLPLLDAEAGDDEDDA